MKRRKVNRRVGFERTEGERPEAKKSFTRSYGVSHMHGVREMALNAGWNSFGKKINYSKIGGHVLTPFFDTCQGS